MYKYYLIPNTNDNVNDKTIYKAIDSPKLSVPKSVSSPKTLKKNISNENFIKYQWAWIL